MVLKSLLAVGRFDLRVGCGPLEAKDLVRVDDRGFALGEIVRVWHFEDGRRRGDEMRKVLTALSVSVTKIGRQGWQVGARYRSATRRVLGTLMGKELWQG